VKETSRSLTLTTLFLVNVLNIYDRQALGAVVEPLRHQFGLSDTQLGLMPALFTVVYAIAGLPLGRLADTRSRRGLLAIGVTVWAGLTGLSALAGSYAALLATRLGVGIGEAVCAPVATSWISDLIPAARRARAMAGFMMAVPIGVMLSLAISGPLAQAQGWRAALAAAALPAILLVPAVLRLREPPRSDSSHTATARALRPAALFWWIAASGALVNSALYTFSYFLPAYLTRVHGVAVGDAGLWTGIGSGVAGVIGALAAAWLGDRVPNRLRLAGWAALLAAPATLAGIVAPRGQIAATLILMMAGYGLLQMYYGLVYAALHSAVPSELRATAMAAYLMISYLCGASFGPLLTGKLSDIFAHGVSETARAAGLHQAMFVIPVLCAVLAFVLWRGSAAGGSAVRGFDATAQLG